jgi:hypothetical protein
VYVCTRLLSLELIYSVIGIRFHVFSVFSKLAALTKHSCLGHDDLQGVVVGSKSLPFLMQSSLLKRQLSDDKFVCFTLAGSGNWKQDYRSADIGTTRHVLRVLRRRTMGDPHATSSLMHACAWQGLTTCSSVDVGLMHIDVLEAAPRDRPSPGLSPSAVSRMLPWCYGPTAGHRRGVGRPPPPPT